jgi:hypothetical protein
MRLVEFDAGDGPRAGLVRRNHVVDLHAANPLLPNDLDAIAGHALHVERALALEEACPAREVLHRLADVRVLRTLDA